MHLVFIFNLRITLIPIEKKEKEMSNTKNADIEEIFSEIGESGPYQMITVSLLMILNILTAATFMVFFFHSTVPLIVLNLYFFRCI